MSQTDPTPQLVERLLSRGLDLYGRNAVDEAVRCWQEVLQLQPDNEQALDYLDAAGAPHRAASVARPTALVVDLNAVRQRLAGNLAPAAPPPERTSTQPLASGARLTTSDDQGADVAQLIDGGQYEQALRQLYAMRAKKPDDSTLTECIRLLRDRLLGQYWDTLGHLDRVPQRTNVRAVDLSIEEERVLSALDGRSSLLEIIESCQLGRLATSRVLCDLLARGSLLLPPESADRVSVERVVASEPSGPAAKADTPSPGTRDEGAPATARSGGGYEELFREATSAYISRRYELASQLFNECLRQRPQDGRVLHNLRQLERRL